MKYKSNIIKLFTIIISVIMVFQSIVYASDSRQDYENKKKDIKSSIEDKQDKYEQGKQKSQQLSNDIKGLDNELTLLQDEIRDLIVQISSKEKLIEDTNNDIQEAKKDELQQYEALKKRIKYMYELGSTSYFDILLKAENLSDFFNRMEYIKQIMLYDKELFSGLQLTRKEIEDKELVLEEQKDKLLGIRQKQEQQKQNLTIKVNEKNVLLASINSNQQELKKSIDELERSQKEIDDKIQKLIQQEQQAKMQVKYQGGKLGWPLPANHTYISSNFGRRTGPLTGKPEFHKGIDIPAPTGTEVFAAADGKVFSAYYSNSYGNVVMINHGGLITVYAHNSKLLVKAGQTVKRGETIALAGSTGYSTGSHCHFEVRVNNQAVSPWNYIGK